MNKLGIIVLWSFVGGLVGGIGYQIVKSEIRERKIEKSGEIVYGIFGYPNIYHDKENHVTCWITNNGGISCLPDIQFMDDSDTRIDRD